MDPSTVITFAQLLSPGGVVIAAATVLALVEILKAGIPPLDAHISGATMAFVLSGLLYAATAAALAPVNPDGYLVVVFAWIGCATSAMGIRAGADHVSAVRAGTAGTSVVNTPTTVEDAPVEPLPPIVPAPVDPPPPADPDV